MIKIAVTELEYEKAKEVFKQAEANEVICLRAPSGERELSEFVEKEKISYVIVGIEKYSGSLYDVLPKGGMITRFGVGHDGIDKVKAQEKGLYCSNTPSVLDQSVAEYAIGLMLAAARRIAECVSDNKSGIWKNRSGAELAGKTLSVIGCGNIGRKVGGIAKKGFGMRVIGYDVVNPENPALFDEFSTDFGAVVKNADFVTLHIPSIPATHDFINSGRLAQMPSKATLINTARGGVVDENALFDAIAGGRLAGAALDVFKNEPYSPQSPEKDLRILDNVIMTPHIGSSTLDANRRMAQVALDNIINAVNGRYENTVIV